MISPISRTVLATGLLLCGRTEAADPALGVWTPISDPSGRALHAFHASLRLAKKGEVKLRVVVFGASHVAGDGFTGLLRRRLQARFGDAGPGYAVLARPWNRYNRPDLSITYSRGWRSCWVKRDRQRADGRYGLAGVSFASSSPEDFGRIETIARRGKLVRRVSKIEVAYWAQPLGGTVEVLIDGQRQEGIPTRADSPGSAYRTYTVEDRPHRIELRPRGDGEVMLFGVTLEREVPGVVLDSLGVNGARASDQLKWDDALFAAQLAHRNPALVVLAYGTNESGDKRDPLAQYESRLERVVARVRRAAPLASCLLVGPSDWPLREHGLYQARPRQAGLIDAQRRVAHRHGCGFWDFRAAMGGELAMLRWRAASPPLALKDNVHLTRAGYERIGELLWDALMQGFDQVPSSR
jgi:lysophospholipase L1-like esterase